MPVSLADLREGDIMFGPIGGFIPGVFPVGVGQLLLEAADRETWRFRHAGIVVERGSTGLGEFAPRLVQAMPSGAEEISLNEGHWTGDYMYVRPAYADQYQLEPRQGYRAAQAARGYLGTGYSFLDYAALAGRHVLALKPTQRTVFDRYITSSKRMICSQLVDQALSDVGFHVFDDGRLPQDVMPAALLRRLLTLPGTQFVRPGGEWQLTTGLDAVS